MARDKFTVQCLFEDSYPDDGRLSIRLAKIAVSIISGTSNPIKRMQVLGISAETLLKKLNLNKRASG